MQITLRAGSSTRDKGGMGITVDKVIQHSKFDPFTFDFDFSLLRFANQITFNNFVQPIKLPKPGEVIKPGTTCLISGWGVTETSDLPTILRSTNVSIISTADCANSYSDPEVQFKITPQMLCAGAINSKKTKGNPDSCSGDSGGALVCNGIQYGIVSSGNECGLQKFPGIYSKVSAVRDWISKNANV